MSYTPPFTLTNLILSLASEISELVGRKFSPLGTGNGLKAPSYKSNQDDT